MPASRDFLSFWAAGRLASGGHAALAYDIAQHRAVELQAAGAALGFLPFPYPPPFLAVLAPFGLLPFWVAFGGWIAITAALYLAATRRLLPTRFALAQAAAAANFIVGQNGFLTSAIFIPRDDPAAAPAAARRRDPRPPRRQAAACDPAAGRAARRPRMAGNCRRDPVGAVPRGG